MFTPLMCIAVAIYFEARGEPSAGQIAVAHVIQNRIVFIVMASLTALIINKVGLTLYILQP